MAADSIDTLVEIGVLGRPHGVGGEIRVFLHHPGSTILERVTSVQVVTEKEPRSFQLRSVREGSKCLLAMLSGVESREQAERLKGARIYVPRGALPPVEADEFYVADLIGMEVLDHDDPLAA